MEASSRESEVCFLIRAALWLQHSQVLSYPVPAGAAVPNQILMYPVGTGIQLEVSSGKRSFCPFPMGKTPKSRNVTSQVCAGDFANPALSNPSSSFPTSPTPQRPHCYLAVTHIPSGSKSSVRWCWAWHLTGAGPALCFLLGGCHKCALQHTSAPSAGTRAQRWHWATLGLDPQCWEVG